MSTLNNPQIQPSGPPPQMNAVDRAIKQIVDTEYGGSITDDQRTKLQSEIYDEVSNVLKRGQLPNTDDLVAGYMRRKDLVESAKKGKLGKDIQPGVNLADSTKKGKNPFAYGADEEFKEFSKYADAAVTLGKFAARTGAVGARMAGNKDLSESLNQVATGLGQAGRVTGNAAQGNRKLAGKLAGYGTKKYLDNNQEKIEKGIENKTGKKVKLGGVKNSMIAGSVSGFIGEGGAKGAAKGALKAAAKFWANSTMKGLLAGAWSDAGVLSIGLGGNALLLAGLFTKLKMKWYYRVIVVGYDIAFVFVLFITAALLVAAYCNIPNGLGGGMFDSSCKGARFYNLLL